MFSLRNVFPRCLAKLLLCVLLYGSFSQLVWAVDRDLKIVLLLGQSNMEGQAYTYTDDSGNRPSLEFLLSDSPASVAYLGSMPHGFKDSLSSDWLQPRDDAWCVHYDSSTGTVKNVLRTANPGDVVSGIQALSPGFGVSTSNGSRFGAELAMGIRMADSVAAPVFLFKSDKGGTTLANDWRPPSAVAARGGVVGVNYSNTMAQFIGFLDALDADLADNGVLDVYDDAPGYEVCAVFWLQGWNEQFNDDPYTAAEMQAEYADNLKDLIYSIRAADSRIPDDLPLIVGESSDQNATLNVARQSAVADLNIEIPDSAVYFDTDDMIGVDWGNDDDGEPFAAGNGFHYHDRAENFLEIGWKAAEVAIENGYISQAPTYINSKVTESTTYSEFIIGVTGIEATLDGFTVTVDGTASGSPADGILQTDDVIFSVNGVLLQDDEDPRLPLGTQIGTAEAYDGALDFGIMRSGTPMTVTVTIPVLGAYTETWPLSCPKSDAIVDSVAQFIINNNVDGSSGIERMLAGLFLLSTGEDQYLDEVETMAHSLISASLPGGHQCWGIGYQLVFLCEYYLRTGDSAVLPRIEALCEYADSGDVEGMYGHGLNPGSGYVAGGILNQPGTIIKIGMTLARECGVDVPVDTWEKSIDYLFRFAGHGPVPYGDHRAELGPNSNGKDGAAACLWSLLEGDDFVAATDYTALTIADSYCNIELGHTGGGFDVIWRALGSMHVTAAYEDRRRNMLDRLAWYYDLCRRHDGSFIMPSTIGSHYFNDGFGVGTAMIYTASRKALRISGGTTTAFSVSYPPHTIEWGNERDREFFSDVPASAYGDEYQRADAIWKNIHQHDDVPAATLERLLYHSNALVRKLAAVRLSQRADEASIAALKAALQDPDPRPRRAALEGIAGYDNWSRPMNNTDISAETVSAEFMPLIQAVIDDPDSSLWEIDAVLLALAKAEPEDVRDNVEFIKPYLRHDDWWLREAAFWAMTGLGDTTTGEEFLLLTEVYAMEDHVFPKGSYQNGFGRILGTIDPLDWGDSYIEGLQAIGRCLHEPKVLDGYTSPERQMVVRAMMLFDEFDKADLPLDISDDIAQHFNKWEPTEGGSHAGIFSETNGYHTTLYEYADAMGIEGAFIIHPMKRIAEDIEADIAAGSISEALQEYYDELVNSIALFEAEYGAVTPYPGLEPTAAAATATIIGGWGNTVELSLDGSLSSDPEGTLYDYVWEANGELIARGAIATGYAPIDAVGQLTLRVTDDQAHQDEIAIAFNQADTAPTYRLLGYWPMDLTSGAEVTDYSAFSNHGTFAEGTPAWVAGKFGNALEISQARDDRATIPHLEDYNVTEAYSLSLWFQSIDGDDKLNQFAKGEGLVAISATGSAATVDAFGSPWTAADLGFSMGDGAWRHIVFTFDANASPAKHLYVDGALVATGETDGATDTALNNSPISFGSSVDAEKCSALFDEVAIWDRAISSSEIAYLHNGGAGNIVTNRSLAPTRPNGLLAVDGNTSVSLSWDADTTTIDFGAYRVYRSEISGGPYTLVSGDLASPAFTDNSVVNYTAYYYVVRTVNTRGLESDNSREVGATPFIPMKTFLAEGLLGYWPMDSVSGDEIVDVTTQENHGAFLQGNPDWVPGKFGNALDLVSQREDHAEIPHLADYNATESYSISFWMYPVNCYRDQNVFAKGLNKVGIGSSNSDMRWSHFGSPWTATDLGILGNSQIWHHVVIIYDPSTTPAKNVYLDGVLVASDNTDGADTDTALNTDPITFSVPTSNYKSSVRFDDLAIWDRALTTDEIGYLFNTGDGNTVSDLNYAPPAPTGLVATPTTEAIVLTWDEPSNEDVTSFEVLRSLVSGGPYDSLGFVTDNRFVDSGLTNGVTYYYVLRAVDLVEEVSNSTSEVSAVPADDTTAPAAATALTAVNGYTRVYLNWDDSPEADATSYNIYRANTSAGPYGLLGNSGSQSAYTDTSLSNGVTYYYRVTAVDLAGNESDPAEASASPLAEQDVTTGLVGYWPLDAAIGTVAEDQTANANHGNVASGSPDWIVGRFGNALQFVEEEQESVYIDSLVAYRETGSFTLSLWFQHYNGYRNRVFNWSGISLHDYKLSFGDLWDRVALGFENDNTWHHVVCVFDMSNPETGKKLYVDGVLIAENFAYPADDLLDGNFWIELGIDNSGTRWGGLIDDLAVWDRALTKDQIESLVFSNGGMGRSVQKTLQTPPIADPQDISTDEDIAIAITLTGGDAQNDPLTFTVVDDPTSGELSGTVPDLTYTPDANFHGTDQFTFKVNDGLEDGNTATVSITVNPINDTPVADSQNLQTNEDVALPLILTASDVDLDTLTFTIQTDPTNGTLTGTAPDLIYTPDPDYHGADSFTFIVNDGTVDSATATVDITVNSVNDLPVCVPLSLNLLQDANIPAYLTASDNDLDPLTFVIQTDPEHGTIAFNGTEWVYTPDPGYTGPDSFTYFANDGTENGVAVTVDITVYALADAKNLLALGLVGYWPMDNTSGDELTDEGPLGNHGAFVEGTPDWVTGKFGNALDLYKYRDDRAEIPHTDEFTQTGAFSVSFWIYTIDCYRDNGLFSKGETANQFTLGASNRDIHWQRFGNPWSSTDLGFDGDDATWRHIVAVYDPSSAQPKQIYVDGTLIASNDIDTTNSGTLLNTSPIRFNPTSDNYKGTLRFDDTAYWNRPLTTGEIAYLYNGGTGNTVSDANAVPSAPISLVASSTSGTVLLSWAVTDTDIASCEVYRSLSETGPFTEIISTTDTVYQDDGLTNGTSYYYFVRCTDARGLQSGDSALISATPETDTTPPASPANLVADGGFGRSYLRWDMNTEPDLLGYRVSGATSPDGPFEEIASGLTEPAFTDEGLSNGTEYFYQVKAEDLAGNLSPESTSSCTPTELQDVATGLVGYWPLDSTDGAEMVDHTSQANHGYVTSGSPDWVSGKFGNALQFLEAEQEEVQMDVLPAYRDTGAYTIAFWVRQQDGYRNTMMRTNNIWFHDFQMYSFGQPWSRTNLGFTNDDIWHHVAITFDITDDIAGKKLFVDGVPLSEQPAYITDATLSDTYMRFSYDRTAFRWGGLIDDVAVWNRALTIDQVESLAISNGGAGRPVSEGVSLNFSSWMTERHTNGLVAFNEDDDFDGILNGFEYVFGTDPGSPTAKSVQLTSSGGVWIMTHPNSIFGTDDATLTYEWSIDLNTYHSSGDTAQGATVTLSPNRNSPIPGVTTVEVDVTGNATKLFIRVEVSESP
ncbi:MAG: DUF6288 domain-containing protein [Verrucomicrobiota bacterium]